MITKKKSPGTSGYTVFLQSLPNIDLIIFNATVSNDGRFFGLSTDSGGSGGRGESEGKMTQSKFLLVKLVPEFSCIYV